MLQSSWILWWDHVSTAAVMLSAKYPPLRAAKARMNVMWMIAVLVFVVVRMRIVIGSRSSSCSRKITILVDHSIMGNGGEHHPS